jgi:uracil-DNA glycosylase
MKFHMKGYNEHWKLRFWKSGEWQVIRERLNDLDRQPHDGQAYCPRPVDLFRALNLVQPDRVRVVIVGQDPYPSIRYATGVAFSIPDNIEQSDYPPTLVNIFKEYHDDLGLPFPKSGDLTPWTQQGVLLWNAYPSCAAGKPGSHHWCEWEYLTQEVLQKAASHNAVLVYLGRVAQTFAIPGYERQLWTSHPSPLGAHRGFLGGRIFSRINWYLGDKPIDWRLPDAEHPGDAGTVTDEKEPEVSSGFDTDSRPPCTGQG